jgi:hypothetical protein
MPKKQGYQWLMAHRSISVSIKSAIYCCVAIILFLELTRIMDVSQQPPVAALGALPAQFGAHFIMLIPKVEHVIMLMPTVEHVTYVVPGLMPLWMEQPCNEAYQGSSPRA